MAIKRRIADVAAPALDLALLIFVVPAALLLKFLRRLGLQRTPLCRAALDAIGLLPVRHHYYEPYTNRKDLSHQLDVPRPLPGIDWNAAGQLELLEQLRYESELTDLVDGGASKNQFRLGNRSFESGDAEYLYQILRLKKPKVVIEIGCGHSTLIAQRALRRNFADGGQKCRHICIEPYEAPWLAKLDVEVIRKRVEHIDHQFFDVLGDNDLLFIDSSHVVRPQGDVLFEYLEILPRLNPGVLVHVHDIFSPRDYPAEWVIDRKWLWNEQYLLEAFLTANQSWRILAGLNYLSHDHFDQLKRVCPHLSSEREPGSFYIQRLSATPAALTPPAMD